MLSWRDDVDTVRHLKSYGLVDLSVSHSPRFKVPVLQSHILSKWKRKNGVRSARYVVEASRRQEFVTQRVSSILSELRAAEAHPLRQAAPVLYGSSGPAEADLFVSARAVADREMLASFLNQASRTLIEPLEKAGKSASLPNYFFGDLASSVPNLWFGLNRIKWYRNYSMHIELTPLAQGHLERYLEEDFEGQTPESASEGWFRVQQEILNGLLLGLHAEISRFD